MPSYTYCPSCGSKIEYSINKPETCPKCKVAFAAVYKAGAKAAGATATKSPTVVVATSQSDVNALASLSPELQAIIAKALEQEQRKGNKLGSLRPTAQSKPQMNEGLRRQMLAKRRKELNASEGSEVADDGYIPTAEDEYFDEAEASEIAQQMLAQINPATILEPTGGNPNIMKFEDIGGYKE